MTNDDVDEAFGLETEVRSIEPKYGRPPAYEGGNARQELDDVEPGSEVVLKGFQVKVRVQNPQGEPTTTIVVAYRVSYELEVVEAKSITETRGAANTSDAKLAIQPTFSAAARADRAAFEYLEREGLDFLVAGVGDLMSKACRQSNGVIVSDPSTIVDADERAEKNRGTGD